MATVWKHPNSSLWTAIFRDETGAWRKRTTKLKDRTKALALAVEWERAGGLAREKLLTEAVSRDIIGGILERSTGEKLRAETVREFCVRWLKGKELAKSEGAAVRYGGSVDKLLEFLGRKADLPLASVTPADCQRYHDSLVARKLAPASLVIEIKTIRTIFNSALRQTLIAVNPALAVELPEKIRQVKRKKFTASQVQMLLDAAGESEWRTAILLGYYAGLRMSDAVTLDWQSVDFERRALILDVKKTGDEDHTVPLHPSLEAHLSNIAGDRGGPVCPSLAAVPVSGRSGLSKQFIAIMGRAGISDDSVDTGGQRKLARLSFHSLRVSFNSELHSKGVDRELRKKLTGHKSDAVNDRYTITEMKTLRKSVNKLPKMRT